MASCTKIFLLCYLLFYPHYSLAFDHVTIVTEGHLLTKNLIITSIKEFVSANIVS